MNLYIKVGSVTNAQRAGSLLKSKGYRPRIVRVENPTKEDGCGYAIELKADNDKPVEILKRVGINIRGVERR